MRRALLGLALVACKGSSKEPPPAPAPTTAPPADADLAEKMRHCPVTLPGVTTEITDIEGGIRFTMHAQPAALDEVRRRAKALPGRTKGGSGKGGGGMRNCPVVIRDATLVVTEIDRGVQIDATPTDPAQLAAYRATSRERYERAPIERATVVREEVTPDGETKLFSGGAADLDGDGTVELVAGGFLSDAKGHKPAVIVYRQHGETWQPIAEASWDSAPGSMVRNIELADTDGDGTLDIVALGRVGATPHDAKVRIAVLDFVAGRLVPRAEHEWITGEYAHGYGLSVGDLDRDGTADIVAAGFTFDGTVETGFVRVFHHAKAALVEHAQLSLDGQGDTSMRVNDIAIGDVDGDGAPEIVIAGRNGIVKRAGNNKDLAKRREHGDLSIVSLVGGKLAVRTRTRYLLGTSARFRSVALAELDGKRGIDIIVGGQYDADGKLALATYAMHDGSLVKLQDASVTAEGVTGEVKDLVVTRDAKTDRVLVTGASGEKPARSGSVVAFRIENGQLVRDTTIVSKNGDDTLARAVVVVGSKVLTIGFAKNSDAMVGQLLEWRQL